MKHTVSNLLVDNQLLFTPGTEGFCAIVVQVIFTHGLFLFLPIRLLCWLLLIHNLLCVRNYAIYDIILSTSLNIRNNTAKQIGLSLFKNFPFPFLMPLFFVNVLSSLVLEGQFSPSPIIRGRLWNHNVLQGDLDLFISSAPPALLLNLPLTINCPIQILAR